MDTFVIGADIAKASFEVAVRGPAGEQAWGSFDNSLAGFECLAQRLAAAQPEGQLPVRLVLEPTGGYEMALAVFGYQAHWQVSRPNPKRVRDWAKSCGRRAKTDRVDARDLARYGAEQAPTRWQPLSEELSALESLLRRQEELLQMRHDERNRQSALGLKRGIAPLVRHSLAASIALLESGVQEVEQALKEHVAAHAKLQAKLRLLRRVPGVGVKNGYYLLLLLGRWDELTDGHGEAKALVAFTGLDPQTYESGTSVHKAASISRMGQPQTRRMLYMGALGGVRGQNPLREFYQGLVGRGKPKKLALTASARKILVWSWAVYRHDALFDPQRGRTKI
jgi:transposase